MFEGISGSVEEDSREYSKKIPGNIRKDIGECSRGFREMFKKIPGNAQEDFGEFKFIFILWNLAYFLSNSAIKMRKNSALLIPTNN